MVCVDEMKYENLAAISNLKSCLFDICTQNSDLQWLFMLPI